MLEKESMHWYVVHTYSSYENKVKTSLEKTIENLGMHDYIEKVVVPQEKIEVEGKKGKSKVRHRKIFPGYVLIKMIVTDDSWYVVRNTRGVTGFVGGTTSKPIPLTDKEVQNMKLEQEQEVKSLSTIDIDFEVGDTIDIISGPFMGREATISQVMLDKQMVKAKMLIFSEETEIQLNFSQIKKYTGNM